MLSRDPRVFTIPPGAPFLPTLADALTSGRILDGFGRDPAALAEATIYLPTRRAARAFAALLAAQGDRPSAAAAAHRAARRGRRGRIRARRLRRRRSRLRGGRGAGPADRHARAAADPDPADPALGRDGRPGAPEARRRRAAPGAGLARGRGRLRRRSRASHGRVRDRGHPLGPARRGRRDRLLGIFRADARLRPHRRRELAQDPGRAGRKRPGPAPQRPDPCRSAPAPRGETRAA